MERLQIAKQIQDAVANAPKQLKPIGKDVSIISASLAEFSTFETEYETGGFVEDDYHKRKVDSHAYCTLNVGSLLS